MNTRLLAIRKLIKFFLKGDILELVENNLEIFSLFLSQLVYFSDNFIEKRMKDFGIQHYSIVRYDCPLTLCFTLNGTNYVAVKGTTATSTSDWKIILNFLKHQYLDVVGHRGFTKTTNKLAPMIMQFLNDRLENKTVLVGHSMGGAIAILLSLSLDNTKVITFGCPKFVNKISPFEKGDILNFKLDTDVVTKLPPFIYKAPGRRKIFKRKFNWRWPLETHKLYVYGETIIPDIFWDETDHQDVGLTLKDPPKQKP